MKKLTVIADWAADPLLTAELGTVIEGFTNHPDNTHIFFVPSNHSTIHGAYILAQLVERTERNGRPLESVFFMGKNEGASIFNVIRLRSGIYICGMNAGFNFSMIKTKIEEVYDYKISGDGNKNEHYLRVASHLMEAQEDDLDLEETSSSIIPELDQNYIGHIDAFGIAKTTIKLSSFKGVYQINNMIPVTINDKTHKARFVSKMKDADKDELVITESLIGSPDDPYLQIGIKSKERKLNQLFGDISPGDAIYIHT